MNAVIQFLSQLWGDIASVPAHDPQRSDSVFAAARDPQGGHRQSRHPTH